MKSERDPPRSCRSEGMEESPTVRMQSRVKTAPQSLAKTNFSTLGSLWMKQGSMHCGDTSPSWAHAALSSMRGSRSGGNRSEDIVAR